MLHSEFFRTTGKYLQSKEFIRGQFKGHESVVVLSKAYVLFQNNKKVLLVWNPTIKISGLWFSFINGTLEFFP